MYNRHSLSTNVQRSKKSSNYPISRKKITFHALFKEKSTYLTLDKDIFSIIQIVNKKIHSKIKIIISTLVLKSQNYL